MTLYTATDSIRRTLGTLAAAIALAALLAGGTFVGTANADWHGGARHGWAHGRGDHDRDHHGWNGGYYYTPPPVIYGGGYYGAPGYYPPPVVYGPGIGITLPGVSIGIQ